MPTTPKKCPRHTVCNDKNCYARKYHDMLPCTCDNFTPENGWEKEFDERFPPKNPEDVGKDDRFKSFIRNLLSRAIEAARREEREKVLRELKKQADEYEVEDLRFYVERYASSLGISLTEPNELGG